MADKIPGSITETHPVSVANLPLACVPLFAIKKKKNSDVAFVVRLVIIHFATHNWGPYAVGEVLAVDGVCLRASGRGQCFAFLSADIRRSFSSPAKRVCERSAGAKCRVLSENSQSFPARCKMGSRKSGTGAG